MIIYPICRRLPGPTGHLSSIATNKTNRKVYASVAQDLFQGVLPKDFSYDTDDTTGADDDVIAAEVNMGTFYDAALQLFQIATTNNWQDIMYANVLQGDAGNARRVAM